MDAARQATPRKLGKSARERRRARHLISDFPQLGALAELFWLSHDRDDAEAVPETLGLFVDLGRTLFRVCRLVDDRSSLTMTGTFETNEFKASLDEFRQALSDFSWDKKIQEKLIVFAVEVRRAIDLAQQQDVASLQILIQNAEHLIQGHFRPRRKLRRWLQGAAGNRVRLGPLLQMEKHA